MEGRAAKMHTAGGETILDVHGEAPGSVAERQYLRPIQPLSSKWLGRQ